MYDFVTIDFETANDSLNSACSIGIVMVKDLEIVDKKYYLIKPPTNHFRHDNVLIHGITYDNVKDCDQFPCVWNNVKYYFDEIIIAHNAQFDMSVLKNCLEYYNLDLPDFVYLDSINITNSVCHSRNGLSDRADELNITLENHHNALDDSITCANIVIESVKRYGSNSFQHFILKYKGILSYEFKSIKATKSFVKQSKPPTYASVKISEIAATTEIINTNHIFYQKNIVLTGELSSMDRKEAMQKIVDVGGILKSGVSKATHFLVVGIQDKKLVGKDGMSSKEEKAYDLINSGFDIKVIHEDEFIKLLNSLLST